MKQNDIDIEEGGSSAAVSQTTLATTTTSNSNRNDDVLQPPSTIDIMTKKKQDDDKKNDDEPLISKIDSLISRFNNNRPTAASSTIKPPMTYKSSFSTANIAKVDSVSPPSSNALSESSTNDTSSPSTATSPDEATDTDTNHDKSIISTSTTPTTTQTVVETPVITDQTNELTPPPVVENDNIVNDKDSTTIANSIYDGKDGSTIETSSQVKEVPDQNISSPVVADDTSKHDDQKDISTPIAVVESSHTTAEETEKDIETGVKQDTNDDTKEGDTNQITSLGDIESQTEEKSSNINEVEVENSEVKESATVEEAKALETNSVDDDEATPIVKEPLILPWWKQRRAKISVGVFIILLGVLALALGISLSASSSSQDQPSSATTSALVTTSSPSVSIIPTAHPSSLSSQDDLTSSLPTQSSSSSIIPSTSTPSTSAPITSPSLSPSTLQPTDKPVTSSPSKKPTNKPVTSKPTSLSPTSNPVASSSLAGPLDFDDDDDENEEEEEEHSSSLCKDTPNYLDMYGGTCVDYMLDGNEAWCGGYGNDGEVGETPNENCCVCKQQAITTTDTEEEVEEVQSEETTDATATATDNEDLAPPFGDSDQDIISKWLEAHNSRRKKWHENGGKEYTALKWSDSLSQASQVWANHLLESGCGDFTLAHDMENVYGENLAAAFDDGTGLSPDGVLERWVEGEEDLIWPGNIHLTQVLWRATTHVGCARASKLDGFLTCHSYVCRYARPGNCNMIVEPDNNDWWLPIVLKDDSPCTPECPSDGC